MKNTIAESKTTTLIIQVENMYDKYFTGRVLVGDFHNKVGDYVSLASSTFNISNNEPKEDKIVNQIVDKFKQRSKVGIKKYGTTLAENNTDDFLTHLQEELFDASLYIEKLKEQKDTYFLLLGRYNEMKEQYEKLQAKLKELC
ncbi:hypothetical protein UFOVP622_4 [uncultured Caudovirales phage]|uniref:Uncharacterized protein n=1 Tax=uncultured Caudovirales phage TaxID=2100421 RepID=A0A6J5N5N6_9CAUD|nr:hypothetical protein UFOVP622_4 [uncultured Caudovirales phage]